MADSAPALSQKVRDALCSMVTAGGEPWQNPRRLKALLSDQCPEHRCEVAILTTSAECGIPQAVAAVSVGVPWEATAGRLAKRLADDTAMNEIAARWVVDSWGLALGKVKTVGNTPSTVGPRVARRVAQPPPLPLAKPVVPSRTTVPPSAPSAKVQRPLWVWLVFLLYLLLALLVVCGPVVLGSLSMLGSEDGKKPVGFFVFTVVMTAVLLGIGGSLLIIPIGHQWDLPRAKRSIAIPLLGSATSAALLLLGGGMAAIEFGIDRANEEGGFKFLFVSTGIAWLVWIVVFGVMAASIDRLTLIQRVYKTLLFGSVAELLVAIPMHLIVRKRAECCAGMATGFGIGIGLLVLLLALGPAVFFLFYRRYRQAYAKRHRRP